MMQQLSSTGVDCSVLMLLLLPGVLLLLLAAALAAVLLLSARACFVYARTLQKQQQ
jgi:hypothetical protein